MQTLKFLSGSRPSQKNEARCELNKFEENEKKFKNKAGMECADWNSDKIFSFETKAAAF